MNSEMGNRETNGNQKSASQQSRNQQNETDSKIRASQQSGSKQGARQQQKAYTCQICNKDTGEDAMAHVLNHGSKVMEAANALLKEQKASNTDGSEASNDDSARRPM